MSVYLVFHAGFLDLLRPFVGSAHLADCRRCGGHRCLPVSAEPLTKNAMPSLRTTTGKSSVYVACYVRLCQGEQMRSGDSSDSYTRTVFRVRIPLQSTSLINFWVMSFEAGNWPEHTSMKYTCTVASVYFQACLQGTFKFFCLKCCIYPEKCKTNWPKQFLIFRKSKILWKDFKISWAFFTVITEIGHRIWDWKFHRYDCYCIFLDIFAHESAFLWQKPKYGITFKWTRHARNYKFDP